MSPESRPLQASQGLMPTPFAKPCTNVNCGVVTANQDGSFTESFCCQICYMRKKNQSPAPIDNSRLYSINPKGYYVDKLKLPSMTRSLRSTMPQGLQGTQTRNLGIGLGQGQGQGQSCLLYTSPSPRDS